LKRREYFMQHGLENGLKEMKKLFTTLRSEQKYTLQGMHAFKIKFVQIAIPFASLLSTLRVYV
jgi:hypothetical protein